MIEKHKISCKLTLKQSPLTYNAANPDACQDPPQHPPE